MRNPCLQYHYTLPGPNKSQRRKSCWNWDQGRSCMSMRQKCCWNWKQQDLWLVKQAPWYKIRPSSPTLFIVDSETLQLLGALGFPFFSGSSVASDSDVEFNWPFVRQSPLFRKRPDRQLASIFNSISNISRSSTRALVALVMTWYVVLSISCVYFSRRGRPTVTVRLWCQLALPPYYY